MENNEPIVTEEQSSTPTASDGTTNRPSNLRSRWKRKNGPGAKKSNPSTLGEIDPSTLPVDSKLEAPMHAASSSEGTQGAEQPAPRSQQPRRARENNRERETTKERTPKTEYYEPKARSSEISEGKPAPHKSRSRTDDNGRSRSHAPKAQIAPATYKPSSLPKDTFWQRIKEFFTNLVGDKSSMFEIKSEPYKNRDQGHRKRSNYSRPSRGNGQGARSKSHKDSF